MKKDKLILFTIMTTLLVLTLTQAAFASGGATPSTLDALYDKINNLQLQVSDLTSKVNSQPQATTQAPVNPPKIKLMSPFTVNVKGGQTTTFDLTLRNIGSSAAKDLITLGTLASGDSPFTFEFVGDSNMSPTLEQDASKTMTIRVAVDKTAKSGSYSINLTHTYKNTKDESVTDSDTLFIRVDNVSTLPNIVMHDFHVNTPAVNPGENAVISIILENTGLAEAIDVQLQIEGLDSEKLFMSGDTNNIYRKSLGPSAKETINFNITAAEKIKKGTYPLTFKLRYKDKNNTAYDTSYIYYVNTNGPVEQIVKDKAYVEIINLVQPPLTYDTNEVFEISFSVINTGVKEAKNIKVTAAVADVELGIVPRSSNTLTVPLLNIGEIKTMSFQFSPTAKSKTQNYPISFKLEYETGAKNTDETIEKMAFEQYVGVNIVNSKLDAEEAAKKEAERKKEEEAAKAAAAANTKTSIPKMIVAEYKVDPVIVKSGQEFDLDIVFQNAHLTKSIQNVKAVITAVENADAKGGVFSPVHGSNTLYFDKIDPKGMVSTKLRMYSIPSAPPRTYSLLIKFKYQDTDFTTYEEEEQIGITVKQVVKFETGTINVPQMGYVGSPVNVSFSINNTGKVNLSNLKVSLEGDAFDAKEANVFIGGLNAGSTTYYDQSFIAMEMGSQKGKFVITGEDDAGEIITIEHEFTIDIQDIPPMEMPDRPMMPVEPTWQEKLLGYAKNPFVWGGVAAFIIIIFVLRRFVFKKKGNDFDE